MSVTLFANQGQVVRLVVQVVGKSGQPIDSSFLPVVEKLYYPNLSEADGYPHSMNNLATGLYYHDIQLPMAGTYIASVYWIEPENSKEKHEIFIINALLP